MPRRRKRRGKDSRLERVQPALAKALADPMSWPDSKEEQETKKKREGEARKLNSDQREWLMRCIAKLQLMGGQVKKPLLAGFKAEWGFDLTQWQYEYFAHSPTLALVRASYRKQAIEDPEVRGQFGLVQNLAMLHRFAEAALEPVVKGYQTERVLRDGEYFDEVYPLYERDLASGVKAMDTKLKWLVACKVVDGGIESSEEKSPTQAQASGAGSTSKFFEATGGSESTGDEQASLDPLAVLALRSHEGKPFNSPPKTTVQLTYTQHLEMMQRWDEQGVPPPGARPLPTRRVGNDGTVEVLVPDEDEDDESSGPAVRPDQDTDEGEALIEDD